jgi:hypothetical protein
VLSHHERRLLKTALPRNQSKRWEKLKRDDGRAPLVLVRVSGKAVPGDEARKVTVRLGSYENMVEEES